MTVYGLESPKDRMGGTHTEGDGHPDKLRVRLDDLDLGDVECSSLRCDILGDVECTL